MDKIEELEKLAELRKKNIITDEEFNNLKQGIVNNAENGEEPKNGVAYVLLAAFLGNFGIHNFYAGYVKRAIAQLLLTLFSWILLFLPLFAVQIWALLDLCLINTDARGVPFTGDKSLIKLIRIVVVALCAVGYLIIILGVLFGFMAQMNSHAVQVIHY